MKELSISVRNPFSSEVMPIYIIPNIEVFPKESDSLLGIPEIMDNGENLTKELGLDAGNSILSEANGTLTHSGQFSGMSREQAREAVLQFAKDNRLGGYVTSSRLKDWLISRQRYISI